MGLWIGLWMTLFQRQTPTSWNYRFYLILDPKEIYTTLGDAMNDKTITLKQLGSRCM